MSGGISTGAVAGCRRAENPGVNSDYNSGDNPDHNFGYNPGGNTADNSNGKPVEDPADNTVAKCYGFASSCTSLSQVLTSSPSAANSADVAASFQRCLIEIQSNA